jgi:hypothetical protein
MPASRALLILVGACALAACRSPSPEESPAASEAARGLIDKALPAGVKDRDGWVRDIEAGFAQLKISPSRENVCAVAAVIAQESSFQVDPVIAGLGDIALKEIDRRAANAHVPLVVVHGVLALDSSDGRTYRQRIAAAKTEKDLSDIYEEFIDSVPLGRKLFDERNPIRTRGPMQVNVAFAEQFSAATPYPYPVKRSVPDELFTRHGSVYFGMAHLLDYRAPYDRYLYRFADYNAGQYSSRNAAFQRALALVSGKPLDADGALLLHGGELDSPSATELAARGLGARLGLSDERIHADLEQGRNKSFEQSALYRGVFALADKAHPGLPRAAVPSIQLKGPKIQRKLTTQWYAERVNGRFSRCLNAT